MNYYTSVSRIAAMKRVRNWINRSSFDVYVCFEGSKFAKGVCVARPTRASEIALRYTRAENDGARLA